MSRQTVRELIEQKTPKTVRALSGEAQTWRVHYAFFARAGFTAAVQEELNQYHALTITLSQMDDEMTIADNG